jgi:hypothetical protein
MTEVGVYRVSGSASDLTRLKKTFESSTTNCHKIVFTVLIVRFIRFVRGGTAAEGGRHSFRDGRIEIISKRAARGALHGFVVSEIPSSIQRSSDR